jgi:hypothetical protein
MDLWKAAARWRGVFLLAALVVVFSAGLARAQDPKMAPDDLKTTRQVIDKQHLIVFCSLEVESDEYVKFRYDHYPDMERFTLEDGVYARTKGKRWLKSNDWGKTGRPAKKEIVDELATFIGIVNMPFNEPKSNDASQGAFVWKSVDQSKGDGYESFTYEQTREKPHPDGVYPRYTFIKYKNDVDGGLLLTDAKAQLRQGEKLIPVELNYQYMILLPAGSVKIETATPAPHGTP